MRKILFLLLVFTANATYAQTKLTDSLTIELTKARTDSAIIELHCALSREYYLSDTNKGLEHAQIAYELCKKTSLPLTRAKAVNLIGYAHLVQGDFDKALVCHLEALNIGEKIADTTTIITAYTNLGTMYHKIKDPERSVSFYNKALKLAQKTKDQLALARLYNNIGNIYEDKGQYIQALEHFTKAAKLQEQLGNKRNWIISLHNIGNVHLYLPQPERGLSYLFKSLRIADEIGHKNSKSGTLKSVAQIYQASGDSKNALKYAHQSYDEAVIGKSNKKIASSAQLLQEIYAAGKNYEKAFKYLTIFVEYDKLLGLESQKKVAAELATRYETEKKELENKNLRIEKARQTVEINQQRTTLAFGVAVVVVMLVLVLLLYRSRLHLKYASAKLQKANKLLQNQHLEISRQKNELSVQAGQLKSQNQQLEQHNSFKNKVFSIISHDLRAPFGSIKGVLDLVQSHPMSADEVQPIFKLLSKDVDVSMNMLNNLLVWSKAQLNETNIVMQPVDLQVLTEENIQLAASKAEQKNIRLVNAIEPGTLAMADKERLNFVLRNLLMNAIKFTFDGGEVKLHLLPETEDKITIAVTDNGRGISPRHLLKLFTEERFTTLGTASEKGTGLGLMLCKEFVESLQGKILVKSEEGEGSTFFIELPKATDVVARLPKVPTLAVA